MVTKFRIIQILICVFITYSSYAQEATMNVNDFYRELVPMTVTMQKKDRNGEICALLKVRLPIAGVKFEGNVIDYRFDVDEYLVYMSSGSRYLEIKCPNIKPLRVDFTDYTGIGKVSSKAVYALNIDIIKGLGSEDPKGALIKEYQSLASQAHHYFESKKFAEARSLYEEAIKPQYLQYYDIDDFRWIDSCDTIITAQSKHRAITPRLAKAFEGLDIFSDPMGFSDGVMVVDHGYGNISLITTDGERTELNDVFVAQPKLFSEGFLSINMNNAQCFIRRDGASSLNWRSSGYNNLFKNPKLRFRQFENGYSIVKSEKGSGLIDKWGHTVFPVKSKYLDIKPLSHGILFVSSNALFYWDISSVPLGEKYMHKLMDYKGWIPEITNDYIILSNYKHDQKHEKNAIFVFNDGTIHTLNAEHVYSIDSNHVMYRTEDNNYGIYNLTNQEITILPTSAKYMAVVSENLVFDGMNCYDVEGKLRFSLAEVVDFSNVGYTDGYMLVKSGNKCYYIDEYGHTLANSQFELPERAKDILLYYRKPFGDGFGLIIREGKWGLIDRFGITTFDYQ